MNKKRWSIVIPSGWTRNQFGENLSEMSAWTKFHSTHPQIAKHLEPFANAARKRTDKGEYWWELRSCDYYSEFEQPKIFWCEITKLPRFSLDLNGKFINNSGYFISNARLEWLAILQSRVSWFIVSQICQPFRLRAGLWQYKLYIQYAKRLPIPDMTEDEKYQIGELAMAITEHANTRYQLHARTRHRIFTDLGSSGGTLNNKLTAWYTLDFPTFRRELKKAFKQDITLAERDEWEAWLTSQRSQHDNLTATIIRLETQLNEHVYALFHLTPDEIAIIEESTKYPYGAV